MRCIRLIAFCVTLLAANSVWAQDWPQWRGPNRDNKVAGFTGPKDWPKELTKKWRVSVGRGEAGPLLVGEKLYVFSRQGGDEVTLCLDAATGKEVWQDKYAATAVKGVSSGFPGPRGTPAVGEGAVCTLGVNGVVSCVDAATGQMRWRKDTKKPGFYTSTAPLIADGKCIVFGESLFAYDLKTGAILWTGPGGGAPYGSPVLMTIDGVKLIVTPTGSNNLVGVNLADGKTAWQVKHDGTSYFPNYSTPLIDGSNVYYSVTGGKGSKGYFTALKIDKKDAGFTATELWRKPTPADKYHSPTFKDGLIFGVNNSLNFFCLDAKTGAELWKDAKARGDCGSILDVGPVLLALTSDKDLVAFKASDKGFLQVAKYTIAADTPTWSVPIIAGNRVFVKDKGTKDKDGALTLWTLD
jgi:outer membrane protein assembly factor BamB